MIIIIKLFIKITILVPKNEIDEVYQKELSTLGSVAYITERKEYGIDYLADIDRGSDILGIDPDVLVGFEKGMEQLNKLIDKLPILKGIALNTTSYGWVDLEKCKKLG